MIQTIPPVRHRFPLRKDFRAWPPTATPPHQDVGPVGYPGGTLNPTAVKTKPGDSLAYFDMDLALGDNPSFYLEGWLKPVAWSNGGRALSLGGTNGQDDTQQLMTLVLGGDGTYRGLGASFKTSEGWQEILPQTAAVLKEGASSRNHILVGVDFLTRRAYAVTNGTQRADVSFMGDLSEDLYAVASVVFGGIEQPLGVFNPEAHGEWSEWHLTVGPRPAPEIVKWLYNGGTGRRWTEFEVLGE